MHRRPGRGGGDGDGDDAAADDRVMRRAQPNPRDGGDPGIALAKHLAARAWRSNRVKTGALLWLVGLFFMVLAPGLHTVTPGAFAATVTALRGYQ